MSVTACSSALPYVHSTKSSTNSVLNFLFDLSLFFFFSLLNFFSCDNNNKIYIAVALVRRFLLLSIMSSSFSSQCS